jgi:hypothetical protein
VLCSRLESFARVGLAAVVIATGVLVIFFR